MKLLIKQDKNGHVLTLAIHPDETPEELWRTKVGTRYGVALVQLDEEADAYDDEIAGKKAFGLMGAKCRDAKFQNWVIRTFEDADKTSGSPEERTRALIKLRLGIAHSSEIRDNPEVRRSFMEIMDAYDKAARSNLGISGGEI